MESLLLGESASHEIYLHGEKNKTNTYMNTSDGAGLRPTRCACVVRNGETAKPTSFIEANYLQTEEKEALVFS